MLLYKQEHIGCFNYESPGPSSSIDILQYKEESKQTENLPFSTIVIVVKGKMTLSYDYFFDRQLREGEMLLLPAGTVIRKLIKKGTLLIVFRVKEVIQLCDSCPIENLPSPGEDFTYNMDCLKVNEYMEEFLYTLKRNMDNGLRCSRFMAIKTEELLFILRAYYTKEELAAFFYPFLNGNARFMNFVLQNYRKVKTAAELAQLYNCSISAFDKKFYLVFGTSTYRWMKQKKINLIYHEINSTDKSLKQIAEEQKFLSLPQFNDYCKKYFGCPPGKMRKVSNLSKKERVPDEE